MRVQFTHPYQHIISTDNLLIAWQEFRRGKRTRSDVQHFELKLTDNILNLHHELTDKRYCHGAYQSFYITDPKPRHIHKASVRDRVLHHAIYRQLYPFFDRTFIPHSYSCRVNKGTHKALAAFQSYGRQVSRNHTRTCWILKCDIKKFFASVDQIILRGVLETYIPDQDILWLLNEVITSFHSTEPVKGLPLGNLTSQLLVNIYMNEFDQFVKHHIRAKHYIRYADDFVLLSHDRGWLEQQIPIIEQFLSQVLLLTLHPDKVSITTLASGVDFLGWVHFPDHRVLRKTTARRMINGMKGDIKAEKTQSYLGMLRHGNAVKLRASVKKLTGFTEASTLLSI